MELSFDLAEKYFWTWLDFWRLGPRRFAKKVFDNPESCVPSVQFLLASLIGSSFPWTIHFLIFVSVAKGAPPPTFFGASMADIKMVVFVEIFLCTINVIVGSLFLVIIVVWPLRSPAQIEEVIKGKFYSSGALIVLISTLIAGADLVIWVVAQLVSSETLLHFLIWFLLVEIAVIFPVCFYYDLSVTSAFTRMKRRRFLEGWAVFQMVLTMPVFLFWTVAFLLLAAEERKILALISAFIPGLPIIFLVWYFRRRLPKLRNFVRAEYLSYWE